MMDNLDLRLPSDNRKVSSSQSKILPVLMTAVLIGVLVNIGILLMQHGNGQIIPGGATLSAENQKQLALRLEKQGLNVSSAEAWRNYLSAASLENEDAARIWYRIGRLYQQENQYDKALFAYYSSEEFAKPQDISHEISGYTQECLEKLGKFAALRYELADRVGSSMDKDGEKSGAQEDPVVAEIGSQKITRSDLDRTIEHRINQQISQLALYLTEDQVKEKKEALLKQYTTSSRRQMFLNQFLIEEVLYRKARESRLMEDVKVKTALMDMERSLLAAKLVEKELASEIKITPGDLRTYFEAHKAEYVKPRSARISHILVRSKKEAEDVRKALAMGKDFAGLAADLSLDVSTAKTGGEIPEWVEESTSGLISGLGESKDAVRAIFAAEQGGVVAEDIETDKGFHIIKVLEHEAARQQDFDEVKNEVFTALRSAKEQEVQQRLFASLKEKYQVVVHGAAFIEKDNTTK